MDTWGSPPLSFPELSLSHCYDPHHTDINASSSLVVKWIIAHLMLQTEDQGPQPFPPPVSLRICQSPSWWFLIPCLPAGCSPPIFRPSCLTAPGSFPSWMSFTLCQLHLPETHQQHSSGIPHAFLLVFWTAWPGLEESLQLALPTSLGVPMNALLQTPCKPRCAMSRCTTPLPSLKLFHYQECLSYLSLSTEILPILKDPELVSHPLKFSLLTPFNIFPFSLFHVPFLKNLNEQLYPPLFPKSVKVAQIIIK